MHAIATPKWVLDDLHEESPNAKPMRDIASDRILLPVQVKYYPLLDALQWHRENVYQFS